MKIFVSHSSKQKFFVKEFKRLLPFNIALWIDEMEINIGDNLYNSIQNAIQNECDLFILIIDNYSISSDWVSLEMKIALEMEAMLGRTFLLPIVVDIEAWKSLSNPAITSRKYLRCYDNTDSTLNALVNEFVTELFSIVIKINESQKNLLSQPKFNTSKEIEAENSFYTLDDKMNSNFPDIVRGAKSVSILARTAVNLLGQYERNFIELLKNECGVKFIFISPKSEASKYVYGSNPEIFEENIRRMSLHLNALKRKAPDFFSSHCIQHAPTMSLILIEKENESENFIIVQLYFLHSRISRDRPLFKVSFSDKWYNAFKAEFDQLWQNSELFI